MVTADAVAEVATAIDHASTEMNMTIVVILEIIIEVVDQEHVPDLLMVTGIIVLLETETDEKMRMRENIESVIYVTTKKQQGKKHLALKRRKKLLHQNLLKMNVIDVQSLYSNWLLDFAPRN